VALLPRRHRLSSQDRFIDWFQSVAPYIHAFRGRTFVIAFGGEVVADGRFVDLAQDLNLLAALGVKLVLVHGVRPADRRETEGAPPPQPFSQRHSRDR
jgi:hypothetical protein